MIFIEKIKLQMHWPRGYDYNFVLSNKLEYTHVFGDFNTL